MSFFFFFLSISAQKSSDVVKAAPSETKTVSGLAVSRPRSCWDQDQVKTESRPILKKVLKLTGLQHLHEL